MRSSHLLFPKLSEIIPPRYSMNKLHRHVLEPPQALSLSLYLSLSLSLTDDAERKRTTGEPVLRHVADEQSQEVLNGKSAEWAEIS